MAARGAAERCSEAARTIRALSGATPLEQALGQAAQAARAALGAGAAVAWLGDPPELVLGEGVEAEAARAAAAGGEGWQRATAVAGGRTLGGAAVRGGAIEPDGLQRIADSIALLAAASRPTVAEHRAHSSRRLLSRLASAAASLLEPDTLLKTALEALMEELPADQGSVMLVDGDSLRMVAQGGALQVEASLVERVPLAGSYSAELLRTRGAKQWNISDNPRPQARAVLEQTALRVVASAVVGAGGSALGLIHLTRKSGRFDEDELELLAAVASLVGPPLAAAQRTTRPGGERDVLRRTADLLGRTLDLGRVVEACLDFTEELLANDTATIHLLDEHDQMLRLVASRRLDERTLRPAQVIDPKSSAIMPIAVERQEAVVVPPSHPRLRPELREGFHTSNTAVAVVVPLMIGRRVIGLLSIGFREPREVPRSTLLTLTALGEQQALAIDRARAHALTEQRGRLAALLRATAERILAAGGGVEADALLDAFCALARSDSVRLALVDREDQLVTAAVRGYTEGLFGLVEAMPAEELRELSSRGVVVFDAESAEPGSTAQRVMNAGVARSVVLVPLRSGGRLLGVLASPSQERRRFDAEELNALTLLGSLASSAVENDRLRRSAEAERRQLEQVIERLPTPIAVIDRQGRYTQANPAYLALTHGGRELQPGEELYQHLRAMQLRRSDGSPIEPQELRVNRALRGEQTEPHETQFRSERGTVSVLANAVPLRDESGAVIAALVSLVDVSELREVAVAKDRFLAVASHELRSPLASLNACVELLELDPSAVESRARRTQLLERVRTQVDRLVRLVDGLIETARMRADALPIDRAPMDLSAVAREAADLAELGRAARRVRVEAPDPVEGSWDRHRVAQVVTNLLSNALRYSVDGGEVVLRVRRDGAEAVLSVRDHGPGVAAGHEERLFDPFVRGPDAAAQAPRGLGLGLFISREIVRRHNGRIAVEAAEGGGALFVVRLPI